MAALEAVRAAWFREICVRTAQLVVHWMRVGFVHGVLNTDNMSVLGLTIDYGPYGWLEEFDPTWTPNTTDAVGRRYRYGQQPAVVQWNLVQLAEALVPLFTSAAPLEAALDQFLEAANSGLEAMNRDKFGFATMGEAERTLVREAYALLHRTHLDYTNAFRAITQVAARIDGRGDVMGVPSPAVSSGAAAADAGAVTADLAAALVATLAPCSYDAAAFDAAREAWHGWSMRYLAQLAADGELAPARAERLRAANPVVVLRNYLAQEAIEAAEQGDVSLVHALLDVLRDPYTERPGLERFTGNRPEWARTKAGCSMLSCSS